MLFHCMVYSHSLSHTHTHTDLKVALAEQEYLFGMEGVPVDICVRSIGQLQRSIDISLSIESLNNILRGMGTP